MIAALYVETGGVYYGLPDVDPWDEARDARKYAGPWPVVAHPPCARWSRLAGLVEHLGARRRAAAAQLDAFPAPIARAQDGGCFAAALAAVRTWGGVLEHPAETAAWPAHEIERPIKGGWTATECGGWVAEVAQSAYGHRALKRTWLYARCQARPADLDWSQPVALARVSEANGTSRKLVERMSRRERIRTPLSFRDVLLEIARSAA